MISKKESIGFFLLSLWAVLAFIGLLIMSPIPQDTMYHQFSDTRTILSISNALNVISNVPFLLVGILGVIAIHSKSKFTIEMDNIFAYYALFFGITLVAFGSGYYHLWPRNETLIWDRLPMTIAFMGLVSIIITEFISVKIGKITLFPLLLLGLSSVLYWYITEINGNGDLRPYILIQFFPVLGIPIVLLFFRPSYNYISCYWWLLVCYIIAKLLEYFDHQVHVFLLIISGHSIKHIITAIGLYILFKSFKLRNIAQQYEAQ